MVTLERAIEIAATAHAGQVDLAGAPYILHPLRVMLAVSEPLERIVAVLHDVVEDTHITLDDIRAEFGPEVANAVEALTKRPGESRLDAAGRAVTNPIARTVKLADVADNMDTRRMSQVTARDHRRLEEYQRVRALLLAAGA